MAEFGTEIITEKMVGLTIAKAFPTLKETVVELAKMGAYDPTLEEKAALDAIEAAKPPTCSVCLAEWNVEKGIK